MKTRAVPVASDKLRACNGVITITGKDFTGMSYHILKKGIEVHLVGCNLESAFISVPCTSALYIHSNCRLNRLTSIRANVVTGKNLDINGADLDYCRIQLSCRSLGMKDSSNRLFRQLLYHAVSLRCAEAAKLRRVVAVKTLYSKFHHFDECEYKHKRRPSYTQASQVQPVPLSSAELVETVKTAKNYVVISGKRFPRGYVDMSMNRKLRNVALSNCDIRGVRIRGVCWQSPADVFISSGCKLDVSTGFCAAVTADFADDVDINGADLDYSCFRLHCPSVGVKDSSNRLFRQLLYHALSIDCAEAVALRKHKIVAAYAKKFHHFEECELHHRLFQCNQDYTIRRKTGV